MNIRAVKVEVEPDFKSKSEEEWWKVGAYILEDEMGVSIVDTRHEALMFYFLGQRYKPDFIHVTADGYLIVVETKGSKNQRGYTSTRTAIRNASRAFPWFHWYLAIGGAKGWELEEIC